MACFQIMPAKFVNLIQFLELKILTERKVEFFAFGSDDGNLVVPHIYLVDARPKEELALRQAGYGNTDVIKLHQFVGMHFLFAKQ